MVFKRKRKPKKVKRKTTAKRRKIFKKKKFQGRKKSRVLGARHGPLHPQWKQAYKIAKRASPFPKSLVRGVKKSVDSKLQIIRGDPNLQKKVVTKLISNQRFTVGSATNTGYVFSMDMSNLNDPLGTHGNIGTKFNDSFRALGFDRYTPLSATYKIIVGKLRDSEEGVSMLKIVTVDQTSGAVTYAGAASHLPALLRKFFVFYRIVTQTKLPPGMTTSASVGLKLVADMHASKQWNLKTIYETHGKYSSVSFTVTVPNIPAWIARNNAIPPGSEDFGGAFVDGVTAIAAAERPELQVVIISEDGQPLIDGTAFSVTASTQQTVLLEDGDFVGALRPQTFNDD